MVGEYQGPLLRISNFILLPMDTIRVQHLASAFMPLLKCLNHAKFFLSISVNCSHCDCMRIGYANFIAVNQ